MTPTCSVRLREPEPVLDDLKELPKNWRCIHPGGHRQEGVFFYNGPRFKYPIKVIACAADGWDHVSVSLPTVRRAPNWEELEFVKRCFFRDDETAIQLHVPKKQHVDYSGVIGFDVLHLWRPHDFEIPVPPAYMI